jgi:uncharacterized protein (DUF58 family)
MRYFGQFLLLLLLVALFFRVEFFFTILYLIAGIYLFSRLWMRGAARQLRGTRTFVDRAFTGDRVPVRLTIHNDGPLPLLWLEVDELLPVEVRAAPFERRVVTLGGRERWHGDYRLICSRRGRYSIGPTLLQTGDPLGIARQNLRLAPRDDLLVYPRVVPLLRLGLPTRSPLATLPATAPLFEDSSRIIGTREYQRGDPLRRVHWTATARTGHLVVKQYQSAIARETQICLDLREAGYAARNHYDAIELAIVVAASLANHLIVHDGLPTGLTTLVPERRAILPPRKERTHLIGILETLAEVQMISGEAPPLTALLRRDGLSLSWGGTVVVITGRGDDALTEALLGLRQGGLALAVILVSAPRHGKDGAWSPPPGVARYHVDALPDLEVLA